MQALRKAAGLSQTDVAEAMGAEGHRWHQQTVLRLEKGSRPLKLDEAMALSRVLDLPMELLWAERPARDSTAIVLTAADRLGTAWTHLAEAAYDFEREMRSMRNTLDMHEIRDVPATVKSMAHDMLQLDAEKIVRAERNRLGFDIQAENALVDAAIRSHPASSDDDAVVDLTTCPRPVPARRRRRTRSSTRPLRRRTRAAPSSRHRRGHAVASVAKRPDGGWRARYRDASGKEHARHFSRRVDAQRWLDQVTAAIVTGQYVDPRDGKVTVGGVRGSLGCGTAVAAEDVNAR